MEEYRSPAIILLLLLFMAQTPTLAEWSTWGSFGDCSRDCGGGLANKTRTCVGDSRTCDGSGIRYRVCNQKGCGVKKESIRDTQCQTYNDVAIKDNYYQWIPHYSYKEPCVLYCKTVETGFILKMQQQVWNGTICGTYGRGVCIAGRCKKTGCDGMVGSKKLLDTCGVCGGDGTSCSKRHAAPIPNSRSTDTSRQYHWTVRWSTCSTSCGLGTQLSKVVCSVSDSGETVDESHCSQYRQPSVQTSRSCPNSPHCGVRWHAFKWGSCSRTCGNGNIYRRVVCLKQDKSGSWQRVNDRKCSDVKPDIQAPCNLGDCPEWLTGPWSHCSVTCGYGQQKRKVVCKSSSAENCNDQSKPDKVQKCYSGNSCFSDDDSFQQDDSSASKYDFFDDARLQELFLFPQFHVSGWGTCTVTCGVGYRHRNVTCMKGDTVVPLSQCQGIEPHSKRECHAGRCPVRLHADTVHTWHHGGFEACSQSCGKGTQNSRLECLDVKSNRTVLDIRCNGQTKPRPITQYCNMLECPPSWKVGEYSECSAPCGGGRQSREVGCIQITSYGGQQTVASYRCPEPIPLSERSCNLQFCQAEWNTGSWGECSVTCGLGLETRPVFCVKNVKVGVEVNVSDTECIGPRPSPTRHCHFGDCYQLQHLPQIKEHKGTFIQLKRFKRVALFVGEKAVLLPNQAVKIRCPVKNFHRKLIFWTKDRRLIPLVGRVRVSSNGALRISRANPNQDSGIFTCSAGMLQATVNITFQTKKEAKLQANTILSTIFSENLNESFINRPQADGLSKMKGNKHFHINSIETNDYDYSSFTTTNWTDCSAKCGWGTQTRLVTCNQVTERYIRLLPESACVKKGLSKPNSKQKCMLQEACPKWTAGVWSQCSSETCQEDGFSAERRSVNCEYSNGTRAGHHLCDADNQPEDQRRCKNPKCVSVWITSKWTECRPRCGIKGRKLRTLSCIWISTKMPALDNCKEKPRPAVSKHCKPTPCYSGGCRDESTYCSLAGQLKLCRFHKFRSKCCATCRAARF